MRHSILVILSLVLFTAHAFANDEGAKDDNPNKDLFLPECSWSTMNDTEYQSCKKKRETLESMTPTQRARYLRRTEGATVVVDDRPGQTLRNMGRNRAGAGRKR